MKAEPTIAVILFPGTNCELEALRACKKAGMKAEVFRWNKDKLKLKKFDAFIIPGGFSYEDRGRSGIVAAKDPIMDFIAKEAFKGKPVLGICNGAQILVETGLIPGVQYGKVEMALTSNQRIQKGKILGTGFYNDWIYMRSEMDAKRSPFNRFSPDTILHIPLAHGEGRFTMDKKELKKMIDKKQTLFRYCNAKGEFMNEFPTNPNGTAYNLAGICNEEGNVLSLMPHPERTIKGQPIFDSLADYLQNNTKKLTSIVKMPKAVNIHAKIDQQIKKPEIIITVQLIITDNEERTIENAAHRMGLKNIRLTKRSYYGFHLKKKNSSEKNMITIAKKIIQSGELINLNKEIPTIHIKNKKYGFDKESGLYEKKKRTVSDPQFYVIDRENYAGKSLQVKLDHYFPKNEIEKTEKGTLWTIKSKTPQKLSKSHPTGKSSSEKKKTEVETLIDSHLLHNPHAMNIVAFQ